MTRSRKLATAALLAAIGVAATAAPVLADPAGNQSVSGTVPDTIVLTPPAAISTFTLDPSQSPDSVQAGNVTVQSNVAYDLTVADTGGMANGGGAYLSHSLEVSDAVPDGDTGTASASSATGIDPSTGSPATGTGIALGSGGATSGDTYAITLTQPVTWADAPGTYTDTLTYTASQSV